ncbi:general secretion pathway protein E [Natronocella acetinitrilica]|uniref:General secretion pathway protein E n=1 Tax=Natronocella acetinitrilica TaxID=414046 RepID=A0AAE3G256_9GAMM|nr:ATPase, T2SS/T4P/T4SS family [Natronocella acetinitrilica]MCP1674214.1 general secretion pathway protein E [Natronocella acetinitrilica]
MRNATALENFLTESGMVSEDVLAAARAEQEVTREDLGSILIRNGFIRQQDYVQAVLARSPDQIVDEQVFVSTIPNHALIDTRTMVVAETEDDLYIATLSPEAVVREVLGEFDSRPLHFVPLVSSKLDQYLADLDRVREGDEESLLDRIVRMALTGGVSDIHINPRDRSYSILFRHLGVRRIVHEGNLDEYHTLSARIKDRSHMDLSERRRPQDGGFQIEYKRKMVDMRVATVPVVDGEEIIIRLLDPDAVNPRLDNLGITNIAEWRRGFTRADGLCLICGPTGSGKTTSLNASIREMDRFGRSIYSVEDPVEYRVPYVAQVNINPGVGLDFASAVKAFMRADPDVIVLGEVRDADTARNMIKAAETGHMVLATLHTSSIHNAVGRLRDIGVEANELRYLLRSVLVQKLLRTTCRHCGGAGCKRCLDSGYGGRTIVSECAYFHDEEQVERMINGERWWPRVVEDAVGKYREGVTNKKELVRVFAGEAEAILEAGEGEATTAPDAARPGQPGDNQEEC